MSSNASRWIAEVPHRFQFRGRVRTSHTSSTAIGIPTIKVTTHSADPIPSPHTARPSTSRASHVYLPPDHEDGTVGTNGRGPANRSLGETHGTSLVRPELTPTARRPLSARRSRSESQGSGRSRRGYPGEKAAILVAIGSSVKFEDKPHKAGSAPISSYHRMGTPQSHRFEITRLDLEICDSEGRRIQCRSYPRREPLVTHFSKRSFSLAATDLESDSSVRQVSHALPKDSALEQWPIQ